MYNIVSFDMDKGTHDTSSRDFIGTSWTWLHCYGACIPRWPLDTHHAHTDIAKQQVCIRKKTMLRSHHNLGSQSLVCERQPEQVRCHNRPYFSNNLQIKHFLSQTSFFEVFRIYKVRMPKAMFSVAQSSLWHSRPIPPCLWLCVKWQHNHTWQCFH